MPQDAIQHNCVLLVPRLLCFVFSLQQPVSPTAKLKKIQGAVRGDKPHGGGAPLTTNIHGDLRVPPNATPPKK